MNQKKHEILLLPEVAERLRVSTATVNRLLARRRKGEDELFPLPLSNAPKSKGRWLSDDVDDYIKTLSSVNTTNATLTIGTAEPRRKGKDYEQRRKSLEAASERLGLKSTKGKQES